MSIPVINSDLVHTVVSHLPSITNLNRAFEKLNPLSHNTSKSGWIPLRTDFLFYQGSYRWRGEQKANGIEETDLNQSLMSLAKSLKFKEMNVGGGLAYNYKTNSILLSSDGAIAAAIMQHYMPEEISSAAPLIRNLIIGGQDYQGVKDPKLAAAAYFFMHIAAHGIDGALCDLRLSSKSVTELHSKAFYLPKSFSPELNRVHLNFLDAVMSGENATFYEYPGK